MTKKILMVCMGNICRSPIAEAVMAKVIQQNKAAAAASDEWLVDSAALVGYHSGSLPDERALNVLQRHGITYDKVARVIKTEDFHEFDYIFGMDPGNVAELKRRSPVGAKAQILLLGDYGLKEDEKIIHDPYYFLGEEPFEIVYQQCQQACKAFLQTLL